MIGFFAELSTLHFKSNIVSKMRHIHIGRMEPSWTLYRTSGKSATTFSTTTANKQDKAVKRGIYLRDKRIELKQTAKGNQDNILG